VSYDLHDKKDVYGQLGVQEYVVWRTEDREIDWFKLENRQYVKVDPDEEGIIESRVFPGLRLATTALLAGDLARVLAELKKGLDSDEHKAFVKKLAAAGQG
jgi:Uma2 family endonuclease